MADLNLDGLPRLQDLFWYARSDTYELRSEIRKLVYREQQRLPAWAKPVMRAVKRWDDANGSWNGMWEIMTEHRKLTEAQLKEIGEDDG